MSELHTVWCCRPYAFIFREKAMAKFDSIGHMFMQLDNKEKFPLMSHGWHPVRENFFIVETSRDEEYIHFRYMNKHYDRKIRNGTFQFHNTVYTL